MNSDSKKKYLFCVSPGRSGTNYLSEILSCAHDICAVHEPEHQFRNYFHLTPGAWDVRGTPFSSTFNRRRKLKLQQIADLTDLYQAGTYAETNPMFSTLWHDVVLSGLAGQDVTVIILRRNKAEVLKSILDLGWFHNMDGNIWMVTAYSVNSLVQPVVPEKMATPQSLILSYLLNVELYALKIQKICRNQGHKVIELQSNELFGTGEIINKLFNECGLRYDKNKLNLIVGKKLNKTDTKTKKINIPIELCKKEVTKHLEAYRNMNTNLPDSLFH